LPGVSTYRTVQNCEATSQFSGTATLNNNIGTVLATTNFLLNEGSTYNGLACASATGVLTLAQKIER
jgi:hypothetical protein